MIALLFARSWTGLTVAAATAAAAPAPSGTGAVLARQGWLVAGSLAGYWLLMATNPARRSLDDGWRCLGRHPRLWVVPAGFGVCHALFQAAVRLLETPPGAGAARWGWPWTGWPGPATPAWGQALPAALLPGLEGVAGLFNAVVTTFPLSAAVAGLYLVGWRGYRTVLGRALRRRLGRAGGAAAQAALVLCAGAAVLKPEVFVAAWLRGRGVGWAAADWVLPTATAVDWLGFGFEYLLGVGLQVYLIALAFSWVRGLGFDDWGLQRFALRRFSLVFGWAVAVTALSSVGISLPQVLVLLGRLDPDRAAGWLEGARWALAAALLACSGVQITLVFHNLTLRGALGRHFAWWRRRGGAAGWLVLVGWFHFFWLAVLDGGVRPVLGAQLLPVAAWEVGYATAWGVLAGWLLASWVCLYRQPAPAPRRGG